MAKPADVKSYKARPGQNRKPSVRLVPMQAQTSNGRALDKNATFGQRRTTTAKDKGRMRDGEERTIKFASEGGMEMSYIPTRSGDDDDDDARRSSGKDKDRRRKGVEVFGAGMEKGGEDPEVAMSESDRKGRTHRRQGMRSGSKNTFRRM